VDHARKPFAAMRGSDGFDLAEIPWFDSGLFDAADCLLCHLIEPVIRAPLLDALLTVFLSTSWKGAGGEGSWGEAAWPAAAAIVGNPPFRGDKTQLAG